MNSLPDVPVALAAPGASLPAASRALPSPFAPSAPSPSLRPLARLAAHPLARLIPVVSAVGVLAALGLAGALPAVSTPVSPTVAGAARTPQYVLDATPFPSAQRFVTDQLEAAIAARGTQPGQFASRFASRDGLLGNGSDVFSLAAPAPAFGGLPAETGMRSGAVAQTFSHTLQQLDVPPEVRIQIGDLLPPQLRTHAAALTGDRYRVAWAATPVGPQLTTLEVRVAGRRFAAMWFQPPGAAHGAFYSFDGKPLEAAALTMPVLAERISSPFGVRIHPISHLRLMHTGVDLVAPRGTRVNAAAAGQVSFVGTDRHGYGRYVVIDHPDHTSTLYAHLSAWAPGLVVGMKVAQGQRIGAVGMTGAATGPHLHFEVRVADQPVDPMVALADANNLLSPMQLDAFHRELSDVRTAFAAAAGPAVGVAMLDSTGAPSHGLATLDPKLGSLLNPAGTAS